MKITVTAPKPRNPLVAATRLRVAGSHRRSTGALRQRSRAALRHELDQLDRRKHSPCPETPAMSGQDDPP